MNNFNFYEYSMMAQSKENTLLSIVVAIGLLLGWVTTTGVKSQWIRILDVLVIGGLGIWASAQIKGPLIAKILLAFFGATTITYNLRNYLHEASIGTGWF
jgi:intracellular septation protein A